MPHELRDNAEARMMPQSGVETARLMPSQQDMMAFWAKLALAGSTIAREQEMFSVGFSFQGAQDLYGTSEKGNGKDNYLTGGGIIGAVGAIGSVPMSDEVKAKEHGDRLAGQQPEKPVLNTPEGQQVRNVTGDHVDAIKAANPNASDGSVKNWAMMTQAERFAHAEQTGQNESFTVVDPKSSGVEVIAARQFAPGVMLKNQEQPIVQNLAEVDNRPIKDYGYDVKRVGEQQVIKTGVEYQVGKPPEVTESNLFQRIGALPLDQQAQVIGAGIKAYSGEMTHQQFRIGVGAIIGLGDGILGLAHGAESLGKAIIGVAQFSRDVMANDPAALEAVGKAGDSLGKLMVNGVRVYSAAEGYLESVGAATNVGDYTKALRDVAWLGQQMNNRWESMSPEEKTKLVTAASVETLGGMVAGFGTDKLAKSIKITEALEALGTEASTMAPVVKDKVNKLINRISDELLPQPMGITPDGRLVGIPRTEILKPGESELGSNVMEMTKYFEYGKKNPIPAIRAADLAGVSKKELRHLTEEQLEAKGLESIQKHYDRLFYDKHPHLKGTDMQVHHALPQALLERHPGLFKAKEVNSIEYLRGVPNNTMENGKPVHQLLTNEWLKFIKDVDHPTRKQVFAKLHELDALYGRYCTPPVK